jgi:hypothetical protein
MCGECSWGALNARKLCADSLGGWDDLNSSSRLGSGAKRSCPSAAEAGLGSPSGPSLPGLRSREAPLYPSRMLDDLALPGDGGCIGGSAAEDGKGPELCGETAVFLGSSVPPRMDDIDMPPEGRCGADTDDRLARSRMPENGDDVGGPRGADPRIDDVDDEFPG